VTYAETLLSSLESIARRAAEAEGVEVAWVELKRQGGSYLLRVFIDRKDGTVGLLDCERVTHRLGLLLDVEDPIESSYTLEVSTPGLDRPLLDANDYRRFTGRLARLKTREAIAGRKRFVGRLGGMEADAVLLEDKDVGNVRIAIAAIESGRLEVELGPELRSDARESGRKGPVGKHGKHRKHA
jgi:ribosome maturation factor RimP